MKPFMNDSSNLNSRWTLKQVGLWMNTCEVCGKKISYLERLCSEECRLISLSKEESAAQRAKHVRNGYPCPKCGTIHEREPGTPASMLLARYDIPESELTPRARRLYKKFTSNLDD